MKYIQSTRYPLLTAEWEFLQLLHITSNGDRTQDPEIKSYSPSLFKACTISSVPSINVHLILKWFSSKTVIIFLYQLSRGAICKPRNLSPKHQTLPCHFLVNLKSQMNTHDIFLLSRLSSSTVKPSLIYFGSVNGEMAWWFQPSHFLRRLTIQADSGKTYSCRFFSWMERRKIQEKRENMGVV